MLPWERSWLKTAAMGVWGWLKAVLAAPAGARPVEGNEVDPMIQD